MSDKQSLIPLGHTKKLSKQIFKRARKIAKRPTRIGTIQLERIPPSEVRSRQLKFLSAKSQGLSDSQARSISGISMAVLSIWKENDKHFMEDLLESLDDGKGYLEDMALVRAHSSDAVLLRLLEAADPEKYGKAANNSGAVGIVVNINPLYPDADVKVINNDGD